MLTVAQAMILSKEGMLLTHTTDPNRPTVWVEDAAGFADFKERLMHAHPADVTGEDWRTVNPDSRDVELSKGDCYVYHELDREGGQHVRVVVFSDPAPRIKMHDRDHVVQVYSAEEMTVEDACEKAIDFILDQPNFNGNNCTPRLVV